MADYITTSTITVPGLIEHDTDIITKTKTLDPKTTTVIVSAVATRTFSIVVPGGTSYITITQKTTVNNPPTSKKESPLRADGSSTPKVKSSAALIDSMSIPTKTTTRTTEVTIHPSPTYHGDYRVDYFPVDIHRIWNYIRTEDDSHPHENSFRHDHIPDHIHIDEDRQCYFYNLDHHHTNSRECLHLQDMKILVLECTCLDLFCSFFLFPFLCSSFCLISYVTRH